MPSWASQAREIEDDGCSCVREGDRWQKIGVKDFTEAGGY
jgi:hypothetical protein